MQVLYKHVRDVGGLKEMLILLMWLGGVGGRASFFSQLLVNHGRVCQISCEIFRI